PLLSPLRGRPPLLRLYDPPVGLRLWHRASPIASRGRVDSMRRFRRSIRYVNAMFPPGILAPVGAAQFLSLYLALQALGGVAPLAYLPRKVLTVLFGLYACAVYRDEFGRLVPTLWVLLVLLAPVASVAAWETARKIRIPEDETDYGTYSKLLGWRLAALLPAGFIAAGVACLAPVAVAARLDWRYVAALVSAAAIAIGACLRFRLAPTRARADLRRYVEGFGVVANGGLVVALAAQHGVVLS